MPRDTRINSLLLLKARQFSLSHHPRQLTLLTTLIASLGCTCAQAGTFVWIGGSGDYDDVELWVPLDPQQENQIPLGGDQVRFGNGSSAAYSVSFAGINRSVASFSVSGDGEVARNVIFDFGGATLSVTNSSGSGSRVSQTGRLTLQNGVLESLAGVVIGSDAIMQVESNAHLHALQGISIQSNGLLNLQPGSETTFEGPLTVSNTNFPGGILRVDGATIINPDEQSIVHIGEAGVANFFNGSQVAFGRRLLIDGSFTVSGSSTHVSFIPSDFAENGWVEIGTTGELTITSGTFQATRIIMNGTGIFSVQGGNVSFDTFIGDFTQSGGTFSDGHTANLVTISGAYTLAESAILEIDLGGSPSSAEPGFDYDLLNIGGSAILNGIMEIQLLDGHNPVPGDTYDVITAESIDISGMSLSEDAVFRPVLIESETENILRLIAVDVLGDLNGDTLVGVEDLDILLANWGSNVANGDLASGDIIGDGVIGQSDLAVILANWGTGTPPEVNIPEPGTALTFGTMLLAVRRRRS